MNQDRLRRDRVARICGLVATMLILGAGRAAAATPPEAEREVQDALARYEAGDHAAAAEALARADRALPDDPRILFDLGTVLAAQRDFEQAERWLRMAAASADPEIAVRAGYNLGCLDAQRARACFGAHPEDVPPEMRREGMEWVDQAATHFADCLRRDPGHADARHNLEVLRLWSARMRRAWAARDGAKPGAAATGDRAAATGDPSKPKGPPSPKAARPNGGRQGEGQVGADPSITRPGDPGGAEAAPQQPPGIATPVPDLATGPAKQSTAGSPDPAWQQAESMISKVRQRSAEKRQRDRQSPKGRPKAPQDPEQPEEKTW